MKGIKIYKKKEGKGYSKDLDSDGFRKTSYKSLGVKYGDKKITREVEKSRGDNDVKKKIKRVQYSKLVKTPKGSLTKLVKTKIVKKGKGYKRSVEKF